MKVAPVAGQQGRTAGIRLIHVVFLDVPIAANRLRQAGQLQGKRQAFAIEGAGKLIHQIQVVAHHLSFSAALGSLAEGVEERAAQALETGEQREQLHQPLAIATLDQVAVSVLSGQ